MSQTESLILSRPLGRRIAQIGDADAAGEPTFDRGFDQTWSDEGHRDRHVDVTNAAFMPRSDFLDSLNAGGDSVQPRTATRNRSEQCRSPLDLDRTDIVPCDRRRQQNLAGLP